MELEEALKRIKELEDEKKESAKKLAGLESKLDSVSTKMEAYKENLSEEQKKHSEVMEIKKQNEALQKQVASFKSVEKDNAILTLALEKGVPGDKVTKFKKLVAAESSDHEGDVSKAAESVFKEFGDVFTIKTANSNQDNEGEKKPQGKTGGHASDMEGAKGGTKSGGKFKYTPKQVAELPVQQQREYFTSLRDNKEISQEERETFTNEYREELNSK